MVGGAGGGAGGFKIKRPKGFKGRGSARRGASAAGVDNYLRVANRRAGAGGGDGGDGGGGGMISGDGNVERVFAQTARRLSRSRVATLALGMAGYAESGMKDLPGGHSTSQGALQLLSTTAAGLNVSPHDEGAVASLFLNRGYYGRGGANALAASGLPAHLVAQNVQGSAFSSGSNYAAQEGPARAWMARFRLAQGGRVADAGWFDKGGSFKTKGPTVFGAGEGSRPERVTVTPLRPGGGAGAPQGTRGGPRVVIQNMEIHNHRKGDVKKQIKREIGQAFEELAQELDSTPLEEEGAVIGA
jgi:hypothetical protein